MDEHTPPGAPLSYQIFHELGKLSSAFDGLVREVGGMRVELNTRSQECLDSSVNILGKMLPTLPPMIPG